MNQDLVLAIALPVTLFFIMFGMGTGLTLTQFFDLTKQPKAVFVGVVSQMILLPILAFLMLMPLSLPPEIFIGFMILALSPGGTTSNLFSYLAGGNLALSISLTAIVSIVTPFTIPLIAAWLMSYYLESAASIQLPFGITVLKLTVVTLIPVSLGMLLRRYKKEFCSVNERWFARIPMLMLFLVIAGIIHQNWAKMPYFLEQTALPALLLATAALFMGYYFARFLKQEKRNARTIAIETSIQNGGVAILVTGTILNNPAMTIAPVMYGILMLIPMLVYLAFINSGQNPVAA
ncbi:MAG: bile acid:sodium symporter family protein [Gammaproteobacteria bacterium]|nr:bile acid:sodium symporter family protein [Gammaproteobacteria bacterium]